MHPSDTIPSPAPRIPEYALSAVKTEVDFDPAMPYVDEEDGWTIALHAPELDEE